MRASWVYGVEVRNLGTDGFQAVADGAPEASAFGTTREAALAEMGLALAAIVRGRMRFGDDLSPPPASSWPHRIAIPAALAAKASVYMAWKEAGISKCELAARMSRSEAEVRRILDPNCGTKLDQLDEAARALGYDLLVEARRATS